MKEFNSSTIGGRLTIHGEYNSTLDIESFSRMIKDPSYCYKFYWLEALVVLISQGIAESTFDEVIDEMIVNAWYSVREFHIHLSGIQAGEIRDGLERAVLTLAEVSDLPANASTAEIKNAIAKHQAELRPFKEQLTHMVPYRALAGFFQRSSEPAKWSSILHLIDYMHRFNHTIEILPYTLGKSSGLKREIYFHPTWMKMIQDNTVSIMGWIQYEKVKWLQTNNPEVPGLVYKLSPLDEKMRKLTQVRKLWAGVLECQPVYDVFTHRPLEKDYDMDHFIPWSFVMNDELWNLMPIDPGLNSAKSNLLPRWDPFFPYFAGNQFILYELTQSNPHIRDLYEKCFRDNLHSIWAQQELYRPGNTREEFFHILAKNMQPVYDSARRQGYAVWGF